jgi:hypothetical protein
MVVAVSDPLNESGGLSRRALELECNLLNYCQLYACVGAIVFHATPSAIECTMIESCLSYISIDNTATLWTSALQIVWLDRAKAIGRSIWCIHAQTSDNRR